MATLSENDQFDLSSEDDFDFEVLNEDVTENVQVLDEDVRENVQVPNVDEMENVEVLNEDVTENVEVLDRDVMVNDVLAGRGGRANNHPGNQRYLGHVADLAIEYRAANDHVQRNNIVEVVVNTIHEEGGRFLRRDNVTGHWRVMTVAQIRDRVMQSFRDNRANA